MFKFKLKWFETKTLVLTGFEPVTLSRSGIYYYHKTIYKTKTF